jgi:hypothetical protein
LFHATEEQTASCAFRSFVVIAIVITNADAVASSATVHITAWADA